MYARGMTVREIRGHLEELYGIDVSPDLISAVTDAVLDEVAEWQNRPLDICYPLVFFDAIRVKVRDEGFVRNKAIYIALGILPDGTKEILGIWIEQTEGAKFWLAIKPDPTGSMTPTNTIGTVRLTLLRRHHGRRSSGEDNVGFERNQFRRVFVKLAGISRGPARIDFHVAAVCPQPVSCNPCTNSARRACPSGSSAAKFMSMPMRRTPSALPRAASGHANVMPPKTVMNFRLAISIAIGPSRGGHAQWIIVNDNTPRLAGLRPSSRVSDGEFSAVRSDAIGTFRTWRDVQLRPL